MNLLTLSEHISAGLSKMHSTCPEEHFGRNFFFFEKNQNFIYFFGLRAKNFRTFSKNFSSGLSKLHSTTPYEQFDFF